MFVGARLFLTADYFRCTLSAMSNVIGYCRVSTEEQAREGYSLDVQEERIRAYCLAHGLELVRVEREDGASGKSLNRPAWRRVEAGLAGEAAGVVVVKLDRLSRSLWDVLALVKESTRRGWEIHSIQETLDTGTAMGRFFVQMLGAMAELERGRTSERTLEVAGRLRREGRRISRHPPFGYRFEGGRVVAVAGEQAILRRILKLSSSGKGAKAIAALLAAEGVGNPRTGRPWNYGTVAAVVRTAKRRAVASA